MRAFLLTLLFSFFGFGLGQSLWLETGLAYKETTTSEYASALEFGVRGVYPLSRTVGLYAAGAYSRNGFVGDAGGWVSFRPGLEDPLGLQAHVGAGLTYVSGVGGAGGGVGLALSGALTYELRRGLDAALVYTHRPLLQGNGRLSQAFDVSAGLRIDL